MAVCEGGGIMFEHVKTVVDGVYKWTTKDGKVVPPVHRFPKEVKERIDYFWEMTEDYHEKGYSISTGNYDGNISCSMWKHSGCSYIGEYTARRNRDKDGAGKNGYRGAYRHHVDFHRLV
jgi:hypothetical protein